MKRLLLLLSFVMMSLSASAQYADISIKRGQVYAGDELLTETQLLDLYSNVGGVDRTADYLDIARRYKVGKTMNTVGLVTFGVSGITGVASLLGIFINMGNTASMNAGHVFGLDALNCRSLSDGMMLGRRLVQEYFHFYKML